jgi:hypothetical protein
MLMMLGKDPSIYNLQAVVNNVLLDNVLMRCHNLLLTTPISKMVQKRAFTTKFGAIFHRLDESSLGSTYVLYLR